MAVLVGGAIALLPPQWSLMILAGVALMAAVLTTPLAALTAMLILAPLRTLIATESPLQLPLDIGLLSLIMVSAIWIVRRIAEGRSSLILLRPSPLYWPIFLFIIISGLSGFSAPSMSHWFSEWLKWFIVLFMIALVLDIAHQGRWLWVILGLIAAGVTNSLIGLYIFFGGSGADHLLIMDRFFRAFGTFGQPNPFGGFLGLILPLAVTCSLGYGHRAFIKWRVSGLHTIRTDVVLALLASIAALILLLGIVASWSRGAWLSVVVSTGVIVFALPRSWWHRLLLVATGVILVGGIWFSGLLPDSIVARINSSTAEYFSLYDVRGVDITSQNYAVVERIAHWQAALNMIRQSPWLGVGFGNYEVAYADYRLVNWPEALGHAHNYYLNITAETGIMGGLSYLVMWTVIVWYSWQARQHPDPLARTLAVGLLGSWFYLFSHSLLDNLFVNNLFIHLGVMLGILALLHEQIWRTNP